MCAETPKVDRLPKWAQEHIRTLERERRQAIRTLNQFMDTQSQSDVWLEQNPCTGEEQGPTSKRLYLQDYKVCFNLAGKEIWVRLWEGKLDINASFGSLMFHPTASNCIEILPEVRR